MYPESEDIRMQAHNLMNTQFRSFPSRTNDPACYPSLSKKRLVPEMVPAFSFFCVVEVTPAAHGKARRILWELLKAQRGQGLERGRDGRQDRTTAYQLSYQS